MVKSRVYGQRLKIKDDFCENEERERMGRIIEAGGEIGAGNG